MSRDLTPGGVFVGGSLSGGGTGTGSGGAVTGLQDAIEQVGDARYADKATTASAIAAATSGVAAVQSYIQPYSSGATTTSDGAVTQHVTLTPLSAPPANPKAGTMYLDVGTGQIRIFNGSVWSSLNSQAPAGPTDIVLSNTSVLEQSAQGFVVGTLGADQAGCTFSLVSGATSFFQIVGNSLQCSSTPLFYSAATSRSITIRATNTVGLTVDETFVIAVTQIVTTGGGGGTPALGTPDAVGTISTINHAVPTAADTGYQGTLQPATNISTNSSADVFRSGTLITLKGTNPVLNGYDCRGFNLALKTPNCTVTNCLFNYQGGNRTIYADNTDQGGHTIEYCTFDGESQTSGSQTEFIFLEARVHQKSLSYLKFLNTQTDCITVGGSVGKMHWHYYSKLGMRAGAHPDCITLNAGYPNQKRTNISYIYADQLGDGVNVVASNAIIKIADNADLRSNYFIHRVGMRGGSIQTQIDLTKASKIEFHECFHYLLGGAPVYAPLGTGSDASQDGPYGAFDIYGSNGDIKITRAIEARNGQQAFEPSGSNYSLPSSQKVEYIPAGSPAIPVITSISSAGAISFPAAANAVSYQWMTSIARSGDFGAEQPLSVTGTTTLSGTIALIPNAYNHVLVRSVAANGQTSPWSATYEVSSAVAATPTAPTISGVTISGVTTQGQTLTATPGTVTGSPTPTVTYQWQRDVAGNASYSNISGATSNTYTLVSADASNKIRVVATAANGVGSNATANSTATALIASAGATIAFRSAGTLSASVVGTGGLPSLTATAGKPAGVAVGDLMLRYVQYADPTSFGTTYATPTGWTKVAAEDFFGNGGGALFKRIADGTSADTPAAITIPDGRAGDYLTDYVECYTGGSGVVEAFAVNRANGVTATTVKAPDLTSGGANRLQKTAWFTENMNTGTAAITGTAPTGWTERFEATQAAGYRQDFAVTEKDAAVGAGTATGETRTFSGGPGVVVAISFLIY